MAAAGKLCPILEASGMDRATRARMQARVVLVVYRSEMARLARIEISPDERLEWENALRQRSIELLDQALASLDTKSQADAKRSLAEARAEIVGTAAS
jgi:hypothetical protein